MKVAELLRLLEGQDPEAEVRLGWEETVQYGELTADTEDRLDSVLAIYRVGGSIVLSHSCYMVGERLWTDWSG